MTSTVKSCFDSETLGVTEKMIQHDVAEPKPVDANTEPTTLDAIHRIPRDVDDFQKFLIVLSLPCFLLKDLSSNLKKKFGDNGPTLNGYFEGKMMEWNKELELEHHVVSLSFKGSFPRIDTLHRLHKISVELECWPEFPKFKRNHLEAIIRKINGLKDPRTFEAYFQCMVTFIETKNGGRISFYGDYDLSGFKNAVEEALTRTEKGEIGKESIREYL